MITELALSTFKQSLQNSSSALAKDFIIKPYESWSLSQLRSLWQYRMWSFQAGGTKLERFLHKNQQTKRKLLNFKFWINDELSKIGHNFSNKVI